MAGMVSNRSWRHAVRLLAAALLALAHLNAASDGPQVAFAQPQVWGTIPGELRASGAAQTVTFTGKNLNAGGGLSLVKPGGISAPLYGSASISISSDGTWLTATNLILDYVNDATHTTPYQIKFGGVVVYQFRVVGAPGPQIWGHSPAYLIAGTLYPSLSFTGSGLAGATLTSIAPAVGEGAGVGAFLAGGFTLSNVTFPSSSVPLDYTVTVTLGLPCVNDCVTTHVVRVEASPPAEIYSQNNFNLFAGTSSQAVAFTGKNIPAGRTVGLKRPGSAVYVNTGPNVNSATQFTLNAAFPIAGDYYVRLFDAGFATAVSNEYRFTVSNPQISNHTPFNLTASALAPASLTFTGRGLTHSYSALELVRPAGGVTSNLAATPNTDTSVSATLSLAPAGDYTVQYNPGTGPPVALYTFSVGASSVAEIYSQNSFNLFAGSVAQPVIFNGKNISGGLHIGLRRPGSAVYVDTGVDTPTDSPTGFTLNTPLLTVGDYYVRLFSAADPLSSPQSNEYHFYVSAPEIWNYTPNSFFASPLAPVSVTFTGRGLRYSCVSDLWVLRPGEADALQLAGASDPAAPDARCTVSLAPIAAGSYNIRYKPSSVPGESFTSLSALTVDVVQQPTTPPAPAASGNLNVTADAYEDAAPVWAGEKLLYTSIRGGVAKVLSILAAPNAASVVEATSTASVTLTAKQVYYPADPCKFMAFGGLRLFRFTCGNGEQAPTDVFGSTASAYLAYRQTGLTSGKIAIIEPANLGNPATLYVYDVDLPGMTVRVASERSLQLVNATNIRGLSFSSNGAKVVIAMCVGCADGNNGSDLWVVSDAGAGIGARLSILSALTTTGSLSGIINADPTWSPIAATNVQEWIAFTAATSSGKEDIWLVSTSFDGAAQVCDPASLAQLTADRNANTGPAWSGDATRIAYSSRSAGGASDIWVALLGRQP